MIRSLYTAATGMIAQQLNLDVIANNLANVNTTGFKKGRADFQDLMYQVIEEPGTTANQSGTSPTGIQVGLGARPAAVGKIFGQGDFQSTNNPLDVAIEGDGFFQVTLPNGDVNYTRSGAFKIDENGILVTSDGYQVTPAITLPADTIGVTIAADGNVSVKQPGSTAAANVGQIQIARFPNPAGAARYSIERLGEPSAGKLPLRVTVFVDDLPASRFVATAVVDDWREVPVLNRTLERGMLISPEDVEVVRLNLFKQPADVSSDIDEVVGKRVKTRINAGETVRRSVVDIPPLIPQGKKILMLFRGAGVTASATGMALDAGLKGNMIRVRNESSKRVVRAKVLTEEEVEVAVQ